MPPPTRLHVSAATETISRNAVAVAARSAGETVDRLGASSREISDAGKGSAVVTSEVKDLAPETAQATEKIIQRVAATQADATDASTAISKIGEIIFDIDAAQTVIAAAVEEQSATTSEMVRNVTAVSTGSRDITASLAGINSSAEQTKEGRTDL